MGMRDEYRKHPKCQVGPGGMKCPCCASRAKDKPAMRRLVRRKSKQLSISMEQE